MTSRHIAKVIEFMKRESRRVKTREEIIRKFQEIGFLDSNENYTPPYRNLGNFIEECNGRGKQNKQH